MKCNTSGEAKMDIDALFSKKEGLDSVYEIDIFSASDDELI